MCTSCVNLTVVKGLGQNNHAATFPQHRRFRTMRRTPCLINIFKTVASCRDWQIRTKRTKGQLCNPLIEITQ